MWSRKGIEDLEEQAPVPSTVMATSTEVSFVTRETAAWRMVVGTGRAGSASAAPPVAPAPPAANAPAEEEVRRTRRLVRLEAVWAFFF